ncbi:RHS repeat domain-containing protein [Pseudomonas brenneri]|uniref:RHS repeat domain-containing protein n=1 Tax=Pseudomonas brenneri TaxID=129817 RepID=UPI0035716352
MAHNPMGTDPTDDENDPIFNATTQKRNVVDPRTGLFEAYAPLPSVTGNAGNGPVIDMSLHYTPVVNNEAALGDGWSFPFTTYSERYKKLTLHSGEVLKVEKDTDLTQSAVIAKWNAGKLTVHRKGGRKEVLVLLENTGIYVPESLTTDGYNSVTLSWMTTPHVIETKTYYQIQLTEIRDATRSLLKVQYTPGDPNATPVVSSATLTFWPDDAVETLSYNLAIEDYALKSVSLGADINSRFEYLDHPTCGWLLTKITSFDGLQEQVEYLDNGLTFPDNPKLSALPCVSTHTLTPNGGGTPVITGYVYERQDPGHYRTIMNEGVPVVRTTTYNYDEKHNVTSEVLVQGEARTETKYTMVAQENLFSRATSTTYTKNNKSREETIDNHFDMHSALIKNQQNKSVTEVGYPNYLNEETGLTPSRQRQVSHALLRVIKATSEQPPTVNPSFKWPPINSSVEEQFSSTYVDTEIVRTPGFLSIIPELLDFLPLFPELLYVAQFKNYYYEKIFGLSEAKLSYVIQSSLATDSTADASLTGQRIDYFKGDDFRKGRQKAFNQMSLRADNLLPTYIDPARTFDYVLGGITNNELTTHTTETDKTGITRTSSQTHSILSGRLIRQVDADGNRTEFAYNAYGKLVTLTVCAQSTPYRQVTTYAYPAPGQVQITEPNGQTRLSQYDGQDRLVSEYLIEGGQNKQTKAVTYDRIGRELRKSSFDYDRSGAQLTQWQQAQYDDWNAVSSLRYSDGREEFNHYDPIALTRTQWTGKATDKHATVTTYNTDETIKKIEWKGQDGNVYQTQTASYSRAKQVEQLFTDSELGFITINYLYDGSGRLIKERHSEKGRGLLDLPFVYIYHYTYPVHWLMQDATQIEISFGESRQILGKRSFDSWGRVTSLTRGSCTETYTYTGSSPVPTTTVTADGRVLKHDYIKELGNRLAKTSKADASAQKTFTYAYGAQGIATVTEGEHFLQFNHDLQRLVTQQLVQTEPGESKEVLSTHSLGARLVDSTDVAANQTLFNYSINGQRSTTNNVHFATSHFYDDQGRLREEIIKGPYDLAPMSPVTFAVKYTHDSQQRETSRQFTLAGSVDLTLENAYYADSKLKSAQLKQGATVLGARSLTYTPGGRLKACTTTGVWRPKTPTNKTVDKQEFTYDALGNVLTCITTFGTAKNTATYTYDALNGYRLAKIVNSHGDYTASANLSYDAAGRVTQDQTGKTYSYDWLGRLVQAGSTHYRYDPCDRLMTRDGSQVIYDGLKVCGDYALGSNDTHRNLNPGSAACTAQQIKRSGVQRTLFELRDINGSVVVSYDAQAQTLKHHAYTAFGEHFSDEPESVLGFNGEYRDTTTGQYPLGMGGRWYDAASLRFHTPDELSPFGKGGPNLYAYCAEGDPVNYQDPTGHFSVSQRLREIWGDNLPGPVGFGSEGGSLIHTILWGGIGVLTAVMTGGTSLLLTAAIVGLATASLAAGIVSVIIKDSDPTASGILAWISLGAGAAVGLGTLATKVVRLAAYLGQSLPAVARNLIGKATAAVAGTLRQSRVIRGIERSWTTVSPRTNVSSLVSYNEQSVLTPRGHSGLFDLGDVNTLLFVTSGVLGNLEVPQSEATQLADTFVGDITWLPFGSFRGLWLNVRFRLFGSSQASRA